MNSAESLEDPALESLGSSLPDNTSVISRPSISSDLNTTESLLGSVGDLNTTESLLASADSSLTDIDSFEREAVAELSDDEDGAAPLHPNEVNSDVAELNRLFINEKCAPDILPADTELIENIQAYLENQEKTIEAIEEEAEKIQANAKIKEANLLCAVYQMEVDRIKFVLHGYQRLRLRKICLNITYLLSNQDKGAGDVLSDVEYKFAQDYSKLFLDHLNESFLKNLPHELSSFNYKTMCSEVNLKGFVFIRVLENLGRVLFTDLGQAPPDLRKGEIYVCQYEAVKAFILEGKIELI